MTLEQLKSLKVGDIVRYTNKEDASDCTDWKVDKISTNYVDFIDMGTNGNYMVIYFNDQDIHHIASTLSLVPPTNTNELQIILHQIRDKQWALDKNYATQNAILMSPRVIEQSVYELLIERLKTQMDELHDLRNKRDNLLKQNI